MQVTMSEIPEHEMLRLLTEELFERNKKLRYQTITDQVVKRIAEKWFMTVRYQNLWDKPVKCVARFVMHDEAGMPMEGSGFALTATLVPHGKTSIDEYGKQVRGALNGIAVDLCNNHDLDRVEFDGPKAVTVFEYHGDCMGNL